ncbi:SpoIIE family protein phosphatase, partial [Arenimonas composti]
RARREIQLDHVIAAPSDGASPGERRFSVGVPVSDTGWTLVVSAASGFVLERLDGITASVVMFGLLGILVCVVAMRRTSQAIARPIEDLTRSARHLGRGDFDYPLRHTEREDEVGVMARAFDRARESLKRQMAEIAEMGEARSRIDNELRIAADIQQAMLPRSNEFDAGGAHLALAARLVPAKAVGGDFYNFFERDGVLWFVIGDVSDKGVPAAVFMARTMTVLEVAAQAGEGPGRALRAAARHLFEGNDTCMFATVLCGVIDLRTGALTLASAAHEPPVLLRADGRRELAPVETTAPLGVEVAAHYPEWQGRLQPGDTLLSYTDGITEAFDGDDHEFGTQRLLDTLDPALDPEAQCRALVAAAQRHAADAPQSDDITVLAMRYLRETTTGPRHFVVEATVPDPPPGEPVRALITQVEAGLAPAQLPAALIHDLDLVIEEVATNVLGHCGDCPMPQLSLQAVVDGDRLALRFTDDGPAFDPLAAPPPDLEADIADRPIGGLGVFLIRELSEEVAYARVGPHNVLRVVLRIPREENHA